MLSSCHGLSAPYHHYSPHTKHYHLYQRVLRRSAPHIRYDGQCCKHLTYGNISWHDAAEDHYFSPSKELDSCPIKWDKHGRVLQFMNHALPVGFFQLGSIHAVLSDTATRGFVATTVLLEDLGIHCIRHSGSSVAEACLQDRHRRDVPIVISRVGQDNPSCYSCS